VIDQKNILITGSNGQLGKTLKDISLRYPYRFFFRSKKELDITNFFVIKSFLKKYKINLIINCAAYTNVDNSENDKIISDNVNNLAVNNISKLCEELEIQLIHISTDYVFDGLKQIPYNELDNTNPNNHYGQTKLSGEKKILSFNLKKSIIIRTSWLYSIYDNNFVSKILFKLKNNKEIYVVKNEIGSPTNSYDLSKTIMEIIPHLTNTKTEIFHFSNLGFCSRFEFAKKINEFSAFDCIVKERIKNHEKIIRPKFSALDSSKIIEKFNLKIKTWENSLRTHITYNNFS